MPYSLKIIVTSIRKFYFNVFFFQELSWQCHKSQSHTCFSFFSQFTNILAVVLHQCTPSQCQCSRCNGSEYDREKSAESSRQCCWIPLQKNRILHSRNRVPFDNPSLRSMMYRHLRSAPKRIHPNFPGCEDSTKTGTKVRILSDM